MWSNTTRMCRDTLHLHVHILYMYTLSISTYMRSDTACLIFFLSWVLRLQFNPFGPIRLRRHLNYVGPIGLSQAAAHRLIYIYVETYLYLRGVDCPSTYLYLRGDPSTYLYLRGDVDQHLYLGGVRLYLCIHMEML